MLAYIPNSAPDNPSNFIPPVQIEMSLDDFVGLPFTGGGLDYGKYYKFLKINEISDSLVDASSTTGAKVGPIEGPAFAILLVKSDEKDVPTEEYKSIMDISVTALEKVIGVSWYTMLRILRETIALGGTLKGDTSKFLEKFFLIEKGQDEDPQNTHNAHKPNVNFNKSAIIGFIHGIHGYAVYKGVSGVPALSTTFQDRYSWVRTYMSSTELTGGEKATLGGIWNALLGDLVPGAESKYNPTSIMENWTNIQTFLDHVPDTERNDAMSVQSYEDLDAIAYKWGIHTQLLHFK